MAGRVGTEGLKKIVVTLATGEHTHWAGIFPYPSRGRRYYRLQWGRGRKVEGYMHIPGGACGNPISEARASEVARWLRLGRSLEEVRGLILVWRTGKPIPKTRGK